MAPVPPLQASEPPVILVVGDSLSAGYGLVPGQGWVALLEQRLKREGYGYRVVNASASGETTDGGRARLDRALLRHRPAIVVIALGGNDGLRGLPVARVQANLAAMIDRSRAAGAGIVLVGIRIPTNYGPRYRSAFEGIYADLVQRYRVGHVPFILQDIALRADLFQADGIHPNAAAQPLLLARVWPELRPLLRHFPEHPPEG